MLISDWSSDVCSSDLLPPSLLPMLPMLPHGRRSPRLPCLTASRRAQRRQEQIRNIDYDCRRLKRVGGQPEICAGQGRSEEHTSELQSLMRTSYAVFCLKKTTNRDVTYTKHI